MSKSQQAKLNFMLSEKLANFLVTKPELLKKYSGCSYVVFSHTNQTLNKLNTRLIEELQIEGKNVIKAEETGNAQSPWILSYYIN